MNGPTALPWHHAGPATIDRVVWRDCSDDEAELWRFELHTGNVIVEGFASCDTYTGETSWEADCLPQQGDLTTARTIAGTATDVAAACVALHEAALAFDRAQAGTVLAD